MNVQWPLLCTSLRSNCIGIFMFVLSFEPLGWGIVLIQVWAVSSDWFLTIALWYYHPGTGHPSKVCFTATFPRISLTFTLVFQRLILTRLHLLFFPPVHCAFWVLRNCNLTQGHKYLWFLWEMLLLNAYIKVYGLFWVNFHGCWGSG